MQVDPSNKIVKRFNLFCYLLPDDGYGTMIRGGIANGLARITR